MVWMTAPGIAARHAFTTRFGGVSTGELASMNFAASRDTVEHLRENYRRLGEAVGIDTGCIALTRQVHGSEVRTVTRADAHVLGTPVPYEADGLVTAERGLAIMCFTADCVPVLLCDAENGVIAAVHCGWRSSVADILGKAVEKMQALGAVPENISAAIGPAISGCCFEVGREVPEAAETLLGQPLGVLCHPEAGKPGKYLLDLKGVNRARLLQLGLRADRISVSEECTMCGSADKYWSHRRTNGRRGAQGALIVLE